MLSVHGDEHSCRSQRFVAEFWQLYESLDPRYEGVQNAVSEASGNRWLERRADRDRFNLDELSRVAQHRNSLEGRGDIMVPKVVPHLRPSGT